MAGRREPLHDDVTQDTWPQRIGPRGDYKESWSGLSMNVSDPSEFECVNENAATFWVLCCTALHLHISSGHSQK